MMDGAIIAQVLSAERRSRRHRRFGGEAQPCFKPALCEVAQAQFRTQGIGQLSRDREAQPGAAGVAIAGRFHPVKRIEDLVQFRLGDAGATVAHHDDRCIAGQFQPQFGAAAELERVVDQVAEQAAQGVRSSQQGAAVLPA